MEMGSLKRKVEILGEHFYCPIHPDEVLLCSQCDMQEISDQEWRELEALLDRAGYLDREPFEGHGNCWQCGEGNLACLECLEDRGEPPGVALMSDTEIDRMHELAAKLAPPWLNA
jgi:hypothetical protein